MPSIDDILDHRITVEEWERLGPSLLDLSARFLWYDDVSRRFLTGHQELEKLVPVHYPLRYQSWRLFIHPFPEDTLFTHHIVVFDKRRQDVPVEHFVLVDAGTVVAFYDDATRADALRDMDEDEWDNVGHGQRIPSDVRPGGGSGDA